MFCYFIRFVVNSSVFFNVLCSFLTCIFSCVFFQLFWFFKGGASSPSCPPCGRPCLSTLPTLLDLRRFDCANKQPKICHLSKLSLHHGRCGCYYVEICRAVFLKVGDIAPLGAIDRALSVALFSTLIIFLFNSASVSVGSLKN